MIYLIYNNTAEYDIIEEIVKIGGKDSLLIEDRTGLNALHRAWEVGDRAVIRLLVSKGGRELADTLLISETKHVEDVERLREFRSSSIIVSALILHEYINSFQRGLMHWTRDEVMNNLLETKPSYR